MLNVHVPINNLSFGHVSFCILRELWKKNIDVNLFPLKGGFDISSFDKAEPEFIEWMKTSAANAYKKFNADDPTLTLWHINGSHERIGRKQFLFTFHELDTLTDTEINLLKSQDGVFVSSQESKKIFSDNWINAEFIPLGYDSLHFKTTGKKYYSENVTCWLIAGKFERRKATERVVKQWIAKFGNNRDHVLHTMIHNPHFKPQDNDALFNSLLEGKKYFNVNRLPYCKTLTEVNDCYNAADIVIDCSLGEAWSLPSFHTMGLGKHAIVHNCSAMKEWATNDNAILIESSGKTPAKDGVFFHDGQPFNQGNLWQFNDQDLVSAFDKVLERKKANKLNVEGIKLQEKFSWDKSVDKMLSVMYTK